MKTILSSTALAILLATGATAGGHVAAYVDQAQPTDIYGSEFIGKNIYTAKFETDEVEEMRVQGGTLRVAEVERDWNDIGEVHDILLDRDGNVRAVLLDIGGFLGIGEKTVAVSMDDLKFVREGDDEFGDYFLVVNSTKDALMDAPEFKFYDMAAMERELEAETTEVAAEADAAMEEAEAETVELANQVEAEVEQLETEAEAELADAEADIEVHGRLADLEVEGFRRVEIEELTTEELTGTYVYGIGDENVGEISELIVTTDGRIEKAIIDVGGFLGIGEKPVAVPFEQLSIQRPVEGGRVRVYIEASEDALEQMDEYQG